jgi:hypothetical protein
VNPRVRNKTRTQTRFCTGRVRVQPAGEKMHPTPHPSGANPAGDPKPEPELPSLLIMRGLFWFLMCACVHLDTVSRWYGRQCYRQHDSVTISRHRQIASEATSCHDQHCLNNVIISTTRHRHHQHDSIAISRHDPRPSSLNNDIVPRSSHLGNTVTSMTWGFDAYFPGEPSDSKVNHQARGLEEYNSNR